MSCDKKDSLSEILNFSDVSYGFENRNQKQVQQTGGSQTGGFYWGWGEPVTKKIDLAILDASAMREYRIIRFLLEKDLVHDLSAQDKDGKTLYHYLAEDPSIDDELIDLALSKDCKKAINKKDNEGNTPLIIATRIRNYGLCNKLIAKGADKTIKNEEGFYIKTESEKAPGVMTESSAFKTLSETKKSSVFEKPSMDDKYAPFVVAFLSTRKQKPQDLVDMTTSEGTIGYNPLSEKPAEKTVTAKPLQVETPGQPQDTEQLISKLESINKSLVSSGLNRDMSGTEKQMVQSVSTDSLFSELSRRVKTAKNTINKPLLKEIEDLITTEKAPVMKTAPSVKTESKALLSSEQKGGDTENVLSAINKYLGNRTNMLDSEATDTLDSIFTKYDNKTQKGGKKSLDDLESLSSSTNLSSSDSSDDLDVMLNKYGGGSRQMGGFKLTGSRMRNIPMTQGFDTDSSAVSSLNFSEYAGNTDRSLNIRHVDRSAELSRMIDNQATEIHTRVVEKILQILNENQSDFSKFTSYPNLTDAKAFKAMLWKMIRETKPEIKSNLDQSVELERMATLETLLSIDVDKFKDTKDIVAQKEKEYSERPREKRDHREKEEVKEVKEKKVKETKTKEVMEKVKKVKEPKEKKTAKKSKKETKSSELSETSSVSFDTMDVSSTSYSE
jgi:hypothetical protein